MKVQIQSFKTDRPPYSSLAISSNLSLPTVLPGPLRNVGDEKFVIFNRHIEASTTISATVCILHQQQHVGCAEHTISLSPNALHKLPNIDLHTNIYCWSRQMIWSHKSNPTSIILPSVLAISRIEHETCSVHKCSSESFTFPCTCSIPPSLLYKQDDHYKNGAHKQKKKNAVGEMRSQ